MQTKPRVIDLSYIAEEYSVQECPKNLLKIIIINSEKANRYDDIIKGQSYVELRGAGNRYNGIYYVEKVSHNTKKGNYKTSFTLKKTKIIK